MPGVVAEAAVYRRIRPMNVVRRTLMMWIVRGR
jgi:hypothetical protein